MNTKLDVNKLQLDEYDAIFYTDEKDDSYQLVTNFKFEDLFLYVQAIHIYQQRNGKAKLQITQKAPYWDQYYKHFAILDDCYALWCARTPEGTDLKDFWNIYKREVKPYGKT
jgi:hypothetical protein